MHFLTRAATKGVIIATKGVISLFEKAYDPFHSGSEKAYDRLPAGPLPAGVVVRLPWIWLSDALEKREIKCAWP